MTSALQAEFVTGPLKHWRHGRCLVVSPTFEAGRPGRFHSQAVVVTTAARRMIELSKAGEKLDSIVVAGEEHDPTLNPDFREISENLRELVAKWYSRAQLVLESDALHFGDGEDRLAVSYYDRALLRFIYGTQKAFAAVTGCKGPDLKAVVENLAHIDHSWVVDACFVRGPADTSAPNEVRQWMGHLARMKPMAIEVWTPAKPIVQDGRKLNPVTKTRLKTIAEGVAEKTGLPVELLAE